MSEVFIKKFKNSFEYAYTRPEFKRFLLSERKTAFTALAITALVYFAIMFFIYKMMNNHFNIAFVVFGIILLFMFFGAGYPLTRNILRKIENRHKTSFDGYGKFILDVFNTYFDENFFEGNFDFNESIYSESRPVSRRYDNYYAANNGSCIYIKLTNGVLISLFEICAFKFGEVSNSSTQEGYSSVFSVADIKTYGRINLCNYEQKASQFITNNEFKVIIDKSSAYFNCDDLIKTLDNCNEMVNITAEGDKVYIEIAEKGLNVSGIGKRKLFTQTKSAAEKALLIIDIVYCISEKNMEKNI